MDESISELGKVIKIDDGRIKNHLNEVEAVVLRIRDNGSVNRPEFCGGSII